MYTETLVVAQVGFCSTMLFCGCLHQPTTGNPANSAALLFFSPFPVRLDGSGAPALRVPVPPAAALVSMDSWHAAACKKLLWAGCLVGLPLS